MASPGYRRCPQDTAYPQDTDSILRIPRYPEDTAGERCPADTSGLRTPRYPQDTVYPGSRMPSVSQDAKPRLRRTDELRFASFRAVRHASLPTDTATNFLCSELEVVRLSIVLVPEHVEP